VTTALVNATTVSTDIVGSIVMIIAEGRP